MSITIESYSEYSIVVRGDTKKYKKHLLDLEGKFNSNLKGGAGWIFSKKKSKDLVEKLQSDIASGKISASEDNEEGDVVERSSRAAAPASSSGVSSSGDWVSMKAYLALLSRVERLESICSHSPFVDSSKDLVFEDDIEESLPEEEEDRGVTGLLRKKKISGKK